MECSVEGCDRQAKAKTYCPKHHARWLRHGDPLTVHKRGYKPYLTDAERRANRLRAWRAYAASPTGRYKQRARYRLSAAVKDGRIMRQPCQECSDPQSEAHHYLGYAPENALRVQWLCRPHHREQH